MSKQPRPTPYASAIRPCPTSKSVRRPGTESLPATIAPPDHPLRTGLRRLSLSLNLSVCLSLSFPLSVKNNKLFGYTLVSRKFSKTTLWTKLEKQNTLKRKVKERKVKEGKMERSAILFKLVNRRDRWIIVWTSMQGADHKASTLKWWCSNARDILRIVNILEDFKNISPQNTRYFYYSLFQVIKFSKALLKMVKLIKLKKLQKLNSCHAWRPFPPCPLPYPYGHNTMEYLYLNLFLGSELYLLTLHKR